MAKMAAHPLDKTPIKVFSLQTCAHCKAVKKILQQQQIPFRIVYVDMLIGEERNKIISELKRLNPACSFPTLVIGGKTLVGFKKEKLLQMLADLQGET
jgi:glutaredoxin